MVQWLGHQRQVHVQGKQAPRNFRRGVHGKIDGDVGKIGADAFDQIGQPGVHQSLGDADGELAAHGGGIGHRAHHFVLQAEDALDIGQQHGPARGQRGAPVVRVEQVDAQLLLQLGDARGYRRLRRMQLDGGRAEAARTGDPVERLEIA
ncbi:hypothetical protein D9M68_814340 [compost metagenome]